MDQVLSIGVVPIEHGRIQVGSALYRVLRADRAPATDAILVHGIRPTDARHGDDATTAWREVAAALAGRTPVVHVQWVERAFLTPVLRAHGGEFPSSVVDTDVLVRRQERADRPRSHMHVPLADAARALGLPVHRPHHALGDALTTAQLFLALAARSSLRGRDATVAELTRRHPDEWWERAYATVLRRFPDAGAGPGPRRS